MHIAIITGGETGERSISIKSAKNIANIIDFAEVTIFTFPEDKDKFIGNSSNIDIVIPMIHGKGAEDGEVQLLLQELHIPFLFSPISTHQIAIDKKRTKEIVADLGILSPKEIIAFPCFVKPRFGGSSVASKLCKTKEEHEELVAIHPDIEFIQEEPVKGREFTVGIVEYQEKDIPLPVIEIIPKAEFFDFANKYDPEKLAQEVCPANIDGDLKNGLQKQALKIHQYLKASHISRSDFIMTPENKIYFLEINTIPGVTETSLIPKMLKTANISLPDLLKEWCEQILGAYRDSNPD